MRKFISFALMLLALGSCRQNLKSDDKVISSQAKDLSTSYNLMEGAKDVEMLFGGSCLYLYDTTKPKELTIMLSHSSIVERQDPGQIFLNVAYRFFRNLHEEKSNYDKIKVVLVYPNNDEALYDYSSKDLEIVDKKMPLVDKVIKLIQQGKYEEVKAMLSDTIMNDTLISGYSGYQMINDLKDRDSTHGMAISFDPYQFWLTKSDDGKEILKLYGSMHRDKRDSHFNIWMDTIGSSQKFYLLKNKAAGTGGIKYIITHPHSGKQQRK